jgi:hypothetical protein
MASKKALTTSAMLGDGIFIISYASSFTINIQCNLIFSNIGKEKN